MKARVTLEIELPDIGATEDEVVEFIWYKCGYCACCSIDNPFLIEEDEDDKVTDIEIEIL